MKNIEQYLNECSSNCTVTINFPSSSTTFNDRVIIVTVFDEDFDDEKTFRFSMDEWKSLLLKALKYEKGVESIELESDK